MWISNTAIFEIPVGPGLGGERLRLATYREDRTTGLANGFCDARLAIAAQLAATRRSPEASVEQEYHERAL